MQNVHPTVRQFVAPFAPPPATPEELEALRVRADLWNCYAIAWGIKAYDKAKQAAQAAPELQQG